ncbi:hypothetical protein BKA62DRAFT_716714 [Auriculariales sp. MPI-PUGE-AT-0066]|nr:hypothetical protein BKA62DRAFT_716714 [Auriculariales sp. MPI-PUGE-AT-0066]
MSLLTFVPHPDIKATSVHMGPGSTVRTPEELLKHSAPKQYANAKEFLQGAFIDTENGVVPCSNGLVYTVLQAWTQHHVLVLRPDDIWLAILAQFNLFVNANAERLRKIFVNHDGKQQLVVIDVVHHAGNAPFGNIARTFAELVRDNVRDPTLHDWALPNFTTTTQTDVVAGAVLLMSAMQEYFEYVVVFGSGLAQVCLAGTKQDWENILRRLDYLNHFGDECAYWRTLLVPVMKRFVAAYDDPHGQANLDFWRRIVHREHGMSGASTISGWLGAFCVFDDKGQIRTPRSGPDNLTLDGMSYPTIDQKYIPRGYADVPIKLIGPQGVTMSTMIAGVVGMRVGSSQDPAVSLTGVHDMVAPQVGWWIYINKSDDERSSQK